jgi:AAA domain
MPVAPSRGLGRAVLSGAALPSIPALEGLHARQVDFRRGQVIMITGRPKSGKSMFAQWMVEQWPGEPCLYCSWDMPAATAQLRQAAVLTGHTTQEMYPHLANEGPGAGYYLDALETSNVVFSFDTQPVEDDLIEEINACVEMWERYPSVIVCDNLLNVRGAEEDHRIQKQILREFQQIARDTGAMVIVLHHARETQSDTSRPPTAAETDGKVTQIPDLVLSVSNDGGSNFYLSAVMNRNGRMDPNSHDPVRISCDLSRVQFAGPGKLQNRRLVG